MDDRSYSFGYWLRRRRKALDLTQEELGQAVSCSRFAIRKIEADERRPSRSLAERLADRLAVPEAERAAFLDAARAVRSMDQLQVDAQPLRADVPNDALPARAAQVDQQTGIAQPEFSPHNAEIPFVGRKGELQELTTLISLMAGGDNQVVLIEGEPGIGKSRLLREITRHARERNIRTLHTNCYEIESAMPYQPVIDLVGQAVDLCSTSMLMKLPRVALAEIAALVPSVIERCPDLPALSMDFPEARQVRLFRAIVRLLGVLGGEPGLVVIVDDIHWVDDTSRQFMHYLARQSPGAALMLVFAYRGEEVAADPGLVNFVVSLRRETRAHHFVLTPLSVPDVESLLAQQAEKKLRTAGLGAWLHRESEGNPLFMTSILHSLTEQTNLPLDFREGHMVRRDFRPPSRSEYALPEAMRASVRARISRVPKEIRAKLEIAAVLGRRFDYELLQAVASEPQAVLLDAIDVLVKRQLLREEVEGGVYDFSHDKVREVVYLDIGSTRRMLLHRAVAQTIEQREGLEPHERIARLAEHFERGQVWQKAIHYLVQAAAQSQRLFAMREALRWFDRAVILAQTHPEAMAEQFLYELIEQRGVARALAGQTAGAVADFERVMNVAREHGERVHVRDLLIELGMAHRRADAYEQALACLNEALAASREMKDERNAADTLYHLGTVAWSNGRNRQAIRFHQEAVTICERLGLTDRVAVQAFHGRGEAYFANAEPHPAIRCYTRSLEYARQIGDRSYESENLMMIGWASLGIMGSAQYAFALAHYDAALDIARASDLQWHLGPTFLGRDHVKGCMGQYRGAWEGMKETLHRLQTLKLARYQIMAHELMGHLLIDLNNHALAAEVLAQGLEIARTARIMYWEPRLRASLAIARIRMNDLSVGSDIDEALATARENSERYLETRCLEAVAELEFARGDFTRCIRAADQLLMISQPSDMRELSAVALRWRAEALLADGRIEAAHESIVQACKLAQEIGRPRLSRDVHWSYGRWARGVGCALEAQTHEAVVEQIEAELVRELQGGELQFQRTAMVP